ncbi:heme biosynthesis HemY N-terminal domain-containing protein, partial [Staphylococcus aureus]|uniref:heme biosynthesis HemY N-terminal domain-containing protein n=1 Tax=Staphylococcus aureus TaxID=1280 RepID=UPI0039BE970B
MSLWRWILLLVIVAALAAFGWHWVAVDPGYVLVRIRGWQVETSLLAAVVILLLAWAVLVTAWRLLRWPFCALSRRHRRLSRKRLGEGLIALMEGAPWRCGARSESRLAAGCTAWGRLAGFRRSRLAPRRTRPCTRGPRRSLASRAAG